MNFINELKEKIFLWPGGKPLDLNNSFVWTFDKNLKYIPLVDPNVLPNISYILIYTIIWIIISPI